MFDTDRYDYIYVTDGHMESIQYLFSLKSLKSQKEIIDEYQIKAIRSFTPITIACRGCVSNEFVGAT